MKIRPFFISVALLAGLVGPAAANFPKWCMDAYTSGKTDLGERMARRVLQNGIAQNWAEADLAIECLRIATGVDYLYHEETKRLIRSDDADPVGAGQVAEALEDRAQREADLAAEQAEEDAERARLDAEQEVLAQQETQRTEMRLQAARDKLARETAVIHQLGQSCTRMFRRDPDTTITNSLCYDYFFQAGLPE